MKFTLEIDLDQLDPARTADELSRILRYWAGNIKHYDLKAAERVKVYDSGYAKVGHWTLREVGPAELASHAGERS